MNYALVRFEAADLAAHGVASSTPRFALLQWMPPGVPPLLLGAVNSHRAAIGDVFSPVHLNVFAGERGELAIEAIIGQFKDARIQT